jgi:serine/threonine protein kinase/Flp pilus assembly protein TadD
MSEAEDQEKQDFEGKDQKDLEGIAPMVQDPHFYSTTAAFVDSTQVIGTEIGPYQILSVLGEGGCGIVYLAQQNHPIKRRVALKVIKPGMDSKQVIARFEAERQALALLDHPNIAHVFDAGATQTGCPYFAMEYVKGVSITEHCDRHKLSVDERLALFLQVCDAVQHAHQKGIIHRDIKPSNILVSFDNERSVPKVIDFGIAKAISQPLTDRTLYTERGQLVGTLEYMSPEQAEMTNQDIDTRTDIYSLGVVLYELLTGTLPFESSALREGGIDHIRKMIREEDPKTPSTKLKTYSIEDLDKIAKKRNTEIIRLSRSIRGDLDWIVIKALEKDRTRRYGTVNELVMDINRHLRNEPVSVGPPSVAYKTCKFLRRHRASVVTLSATIAFFVGIVFGTFMYLRVVSERDRTHELKQSQLLLHAQELFTRRQYQDARSLIQPLLQVEPEIREARLLDAKISLELGENLPNIILRLEDLLGKTDDVTAQAHFVLSTIYHEVDVANPTDETFYVQKWKYHRDKAEEMLSNPAVSNYLKAMAAGTVSESIQFLNKALEYDNSHYDSLRERAIIHSLNGDFQRTVRDTAKMIGIQPENPYGFLLSGNALRELKRFDEAIEDYNTAIRLNPDDPNPYNERRIAYMRMGEYGKALLDAHRCMELRPEDTYYRFCVFCALVAQGRYPEAHEEYERIVRRVGRSGFDKWARVYVFDVLAENRTWHPSGESPSGTAYLVMNEAEQFYDRLATQGKRIAKDGFYATSSAKGLVAYSRGIYGKSGIQILDPDSGARRLLTTSGTDPKWSPDSKHILYLRERSLLSSGILATASDTSNLNFYASRQVWLMNSDGSGGTRKLTNGNYPSWTRDGRHFYYQSPSEGMLYVLPVESFDHLPEPVIRCPGLCPAISPDEKYVAYEVNRFIKIVEIKTGNTVACFLGPVTTWGQILIWTPDQNGLIVSGWDGGIWLYLIQNKSLVRIVEGPFECVSMLPDGQLLCSTCPERDVWMIRPKSFDTKAGPTLEQDLEEKIGFYSSRISVFPNDPEYYIARAECYLHLNNEKQVFSDIEKYASILKDPSQIARQCDNLAKQLTYFPQNRISSEILLHLAQRAIDGNPENSDFQTTLGMAFYRAGEWRDAVRILTSIEQGKGNSSDLFFLSMAYWQIGEREKARKYFREAEQKAFETSTKDIFLGETLHLLRDEASELFSFE